MPHSLALFTLVPFNGNQRAQDAVAHPENSHHVSTTPQGVKGLDVGFQIRGKSSTTLATIGRGMEADIFVGGFSIAKVQCSFEIDLDTGVVMFYDRSHACTTQVDGEHATPFERGRVRKVVVQNKLNTIIGMGGERQNHVEFALAWHRDQTQTAKMIKRYEAMPCG